MFWLCGKEIVDIRYHNIAGQIKITWTFTISSIAFSLLQEHKSGVFAGDIGVIMSWLSPRQNYRQGIRSSKKGMGWYMVTDLQAMPWCIICCAPNRSMRTSPLFMVNSPILTAHKIINVLTRFLGGRVGRFLLGLSGVKYESLAETSLTA